MDFISANVTSLKIASLLENEVLRTYCESTLKHKLALPDEMLAILPPKSFVKNRLFSQISELLKERAHQSRGLTCVYFGPRRSGKTTTSVGVLKLFTKMFGRDAPCLFVDSNTRVRTSFRAELGVPDGIDDRKLVTLLGGTLGYTGDAPSTATQKYENSLTIVPPLIVIDNIARLDTEDLDFITLLYKQVHASRLLLFLMTDSEASANILCARNGKVRICPLPGMFDEPDSGWDIVEDANVTGGLTATGIKWKDGSWTPEQLTYIVLQTYGQYQWNDYLVTKEEFDVSKAAVQSSTMSSRTLVDPKLKRRTAAEMEATEKIGKTVEEAANGDSKEEEEARILIFAVGCKTPDDILARADQIISHSNKELYSYQRDMDDISI